MGVRSDGMEEAAKVVREELLRRRGDEVDLIVEYGSRVKGNTHRFSDYDASWVPTKEGIWESITVLFQGLMIDLYPMHWSTLERMSEFDNPSSSVLLVSRIVYARNEGARTRFASLAARLHEGLDLEQSPKAVGRAERTLKEAGYPFLLLEESARRGSVAGCVQQSLEIVRTLLHSLAVLNRACIDTRKLEQVYALPLLPEGFRACMERIARTADPTELLEGCRDLIDSTRGLLLSERRRCARSETSYPEVCRAMYPEVKADVYHILLACERGDFLMAKGSVVSLYRELSQRIAQVEDHYEPSECTCLEDEGRDLAAIGFPDLFACLETGDLDELGRRTHDFDLCIRGFFTRHGVGLNEFETVDDLREACAQARV